MQANSRPGIHSLLSRSTVRLGMISVLTLTSSIAMATAMSARTPEEMSPTTQREQIAQTQSTIALTGSFMAAEAPTTGTAKIVTEAGHRYLEIDAAFSTTDQAPDLHVLLDPANVPPSSYTNFNGYVNLGKLQKVNGAQRYPIPDVINVAQFKSVVIWCRMANATIGYASLGQTSGMVR